MRANSEDHAGRTRAGAVIAELGVVGGEITVEGRRLAAAAAAASLSVRWLDFAASEAQAAIAAQGAGSVRLPLVIVNGTHTLQRPQFTEVMACIAAVRSGDGVLPAGVVALGRDREAGGYGRSMLPRPVSREPLPRLAA